MKSMNLVKVMFLLVLGFAAAILSKDEGEVISKGGLHSKNNRLDLHREEDLASKTYFPPELEHGNLRKQLKENNSKAERNLGKSREEDSFTHIGNWKDKDSNRALETIDDLFRKRIEEWELEDWILILVVLFVLSFVFRILARIGCCGCSLLDCLACFICWDLFCDPSPGLNYAGGLV